VINLVARGFSWSIFTTSLELILCEILEKIRSLRHATSRRVRRHALQKNFLYNFWILRAPPKNSSKKEKKVFLLSSALNRAVWRCFASARGQKVFSPKPSPLFARSPE